MALQYKSDLGASRPQLYASIQLLLCCVFFQELNNVADIYKFEDVLVFDFNTEFIFANHNHISKLDRVDTKVICEIGLKSDFIRVELQLFYEQVFQSFKHNFMSSNKFSFLGLDLAFDTILYIIQ